MNIEVLERLEQRINDSLSVIKDLRDEKNKAPITELKDPGIPPEKVNVMKIKLQEIVHWLDDLDVVLKTEKSS